MHKHFHVPDRYFLSHSVGCLPKTTAQALQESLFHPWQIKGGNAWSDWLETLGDLRAGMANLLGVTQADICPQANVSSALTKVLYSLPKRPGRDTILLSRQDFPTVGFVLKQAEHAGYILRFIDGDITDPNVWADAMDARVQIVHITHALSNTSQLLPVAEICQSARKNDIFSVVDIAQSVGAVSIHIPDWKPDFVTGSSVKFLCGGAGAGFLYIAPQTLSRCNPVDVGWFSHENPFEMDIDNFRYADDAMKFFGGTPSPAPFACALNALKLWQKIGTPYSKIQSGLTQLISSAPSDAIVSPIAQSMRGGTLVIAPKDRETLRSNLDVAAIQYDERKEGFRFSVHGYTQAHDIEVLQSVLSQI